MSRFMRASSARRAFRCRTNRGQVRNYSESLAGLARRARTVADKIITDLSPICSGRELLEHPPARLHAEEQRDDAADERGDGEHQEDAAQAAGGQDHADDER